jgi:mannose-6-phosphate isomerase-like protein (cupin superfamily)
MQLHTDSAINIMRLSVLLISVFVSVSAAGAQDSTSYRRSSAGTRILENDAGTTIRILVERSVLGDSGIEIAEATLPVGAGAGAASHRHGSAEMIYVISGELDHVVNGIAHRLTPGMVGIVKPSDTVIHRVVGSTPVKVLLIWAPGGEVERLAQRFRQRPIR